MAWWLQIALDSENLFKFGSESVVSCVHFARPREEKSCIWCDFYVYKQRWVEGE